MHLPAQPPPYPREALDELIATGEAVFSLIRFSELDTCIKNAFYQLEKQFHYYASQATGEGEFNE